MELDDQMCLEVYKDHWHKALDCINNGTDKDDYETIFKHIDIMISIIVRKCDSDSAVLDDILQFNQENTIFQILLLYFKQESLSGEIKEFGLLNQMKMYDDLLNYLPAKYICQKNMISGLFGLLEECSIRTSVKIENLSVHMMYHLAVIVTRNGEFNEFIKKIAKAQYNEPYYFVGLLIQMLHRDKDIGRLSQEAILLLLNNAKHSKNDFNRYIIHRSDFSAIITTVLSGLYSSFPRKLHNMMGSRGDKVTNNNRDTLDDEWQQLTRHHIYGIPELLHCLQLLDFINIVLKISHCAVQRDILTFLYNGFLSPVIGPSLHQNSLEETISATAYLELFLRHLSHPRLIKLFLQFILMERKDNYVILDSLINRLSAITQDSIEGMHRLGLVTLNLFKTIINFNCEDVLFHLVFKYLIPCNHLISGKIYSSFNTSSINQSYNEFDDVANDNEDNTNQFNLNNLNNAIRQQLHPIKFNEDLSSSTDQFLQISLGVYSEQQEQIDSVRKIERDQRRASQNPVVLQKLQRYRLSSPFHSYLQSAAIHVNRRILATSNWCFSYDGCYSPVPGVFHDNMPSNSQDNTLSISNNNVGCNDLINNCYIDAGCHGCSACCHGDDGVSDADTVVISDDDDVGAMEHELNNDRVSHQDPQENNELDRDQNVPLSAAKDVGYYSNNGSASTVISRVVNLPPPLPNTTTNTSLSRVQGKTHAGRYGNSTQTSNLASKLSKSVQSIYKLHYHMPKDNDDDDDPDLDQPDQPDDNDSSDHHKDQPSHHNNVQEDSSDQHVDRTELHLHDTSNNELPLRSNSIHQNEDIVTPTPQSITELRHDDNYYDVNMDNVLLSTSPDSDLDEFIMSLKLLRYSNIQDRNISREWSLDWQGDFSLILMLPQNGEDVLHDRDRVGHAACNSDEEEDKLGDIQLVDSVLQKDATGDSQPDSQQAPHLSPNKEEVLFTRRLQSFDNSMYTSPSHINYTITLGPFLSALFQRLAHFPYNNFFMNLLLTGIIHDLACYQHPLIKNLLLDTSIILQPHLNKLFNILSSVKDKLQQLSNNIVNWETILDSAYEYLYFRIYPNFKPAKDPPSSRHSLNFDEEFDFHVVTDSSINSNKDDFFSNFIIPLSSNKDKKTKRTPFGILNRKKKLSYPEYKFPVSKNAYSNKRTINEQEAQRIRNLAYNWILYDEFCKELASLCQEHTQHCFF